jgi:NAD(P)-dependent dehydrogenase (short-subunit alcohol dehydrogenase family)
LVKGRCPAWTLADIAGAIGDFVAPSDHSLAQAVDVFSTNAMGTFHGSRAARHFMSMQHNGTLVSMYGHGSFLRAASPAGLYGASKAWVASFTRTLAKRIAGSGVRLVGFSPGMLTTEMLTAPTAIGELGRAMMKNYALVLRLLGKPAEKAAERLETVTRSNRREFAEYHMFKPWLPNRGMLRIAWEQLTRTGSPAKSRLKFLPAYMPEI